MGVMLTRNPLVGVSECLSDDRERNSRHRKRRTVRVPENVEAGGLHIRLEAGVVHRSDLM